jgi:hypothetical protein
MNLEIPINIIEELFMNIRVPLYPNSALMTELQQSMESYICNRLGAGKLVSLKTAFDHCVRELE